MWEREGTCAASAVDKKDAERWDEISKIKRELKSSLHPHHRQAVLVFQVRQIVGDFAVMLAIVIMVGVDLLCGIDTPKLNVPSEFRVSSCPLFTDR